MRCLTLEAHWLGCTTNASLAMPEKANMICPFLNFCMLRRHVIFLWLEQEITQFSSVSKIVQQDATMYSLLYFCKLLYMFRVVTPPIIRSTYSCNYSIWHWSNRLYCLPRRWRRWNWKFQRLHRGLFLVFIYGIPRRLF